MTSLVSGRSFLRSSKNGRIKTKNLGAFQVEPVYTVRFAEVIVVLHVFQKKSKRGKETPKQDKELIRSRLKLAEELYKEWKIKEGKND